QQLRTEQAAAQATQKSMQELLAKTAKEIACFADEWQTLITEPSIDTVTTDAWQDAAALAATRTTIELGLATLVLRLQTAEQGEQAINAAEKAISDATQTLLNANSQHKLLQQSVETAALRQGEI